MTAIILYNNIMIMKMKMMMMMVMKMMIMMMKMMMMMVVIKMVIMMMMTMMKVVSDLLAGGIAADVASSKVGKVCTTEGEDTTNCGTQTTTHLECPTGGGDVLLSDWVRRIYRGRLQ